MRFCNTDMPASSDHLIELADGWLLWKTACLRAPACRCIGWSGSPRGLPRWVFARFASERKPVYVDFASPVSVDALAKLIRRGMREESAEVVVSEMLPSPAECWLTDAEGNRYTSELRLAALHPEPWRPRATPAAV
jgi:hypothetical protein